MANSIQIKATTDNGLTLKELGNVLAQRMEYLHESARDSIAATAIQVLKSIRTITKVAKKSSVKVDVKHDKSIYPSFYTAGGRKIFCLRVTGSKTRYDGNEIVKNYLKVNCQNGHAFRFTDENGRKAKHYILIDSSMASAKRNAKQIVLRRAMRYAGLAKRAIGILMYKTNTKRVNDGLLNPLVENKAAEVTSKRESVMKSVDGKTGTYTLVLEDALRYALNAVKGGKSQVDIQMKKAMNKVVSTINHRIGNA